MIRLSTRRTSALFALALVLSSSACSNVGPRRGRDVDSTASTRLDAATTVDIAVLPVENATGKKSVPVKDLRAAFSNALVQRRYSPLALEYVDAQITDAAFRPGSVKEDAQLVVTVEGWDDAVWATHGAVTVKIGARLVDSHGGGDLWRGALEKRMELGKDNDAYSTDAPRRAAFCRLVAAEVLAALPARSAKPGRAR